MNSITNNLAGIKGQAGFDRTLSRQENILKRGRAKSFENELKKNMPPHEIKIDSKGKGKPVDNKLMDVCIEMESLFVAKMLKEMRKTVHKNDMLHGGFAEDVFEDMLYDKYALEISKKANLGLARQLYDEMSRK